MFLSLPLQRLRLRPDLGRCAEERGPAGMAVVIIREDLIRDDLDPKTPIYLMYKTHADNGSMYNTPNCWAIYCCGKVFKYLLNMGGLEEMEKRNIEKAKVLYDFLDSSKLFKGAVVPQDPQPHERPFVTGDKDLDAAVVAASKEAGFDNLKGHKSVGGLRASIYNAMPRRVWRLWWSSSPSSRLSIRRNVCLSGRRSGKPDHRHIPTTKRIIEGEYYYAYSYYRRYGQGRHGAAA